MLWGFSNEMKNVKNRFFSLTENTNVIDRPSCFKLNLGRRARMHICFRLCPHQQCLELVILADVGSPVWRLWFICY
jgi:hypothetical protein